MTTVFVLCAAFIITTFVFCRMMTIHHGEIDYSLIADGKPPLYAKEYAMSSDVGMTWYQGLGYSVYNVHSSHAEVKIEGYVVALRIRYYRLVDLHGE